MTSVIYASLSAFLIFWLSLNVIKARGRNRIKYGDGGNEELQIARVAQSNAVQYIPLPCCSYLRLNIITQISGVFIFWEWR